MHTHIHTYSTEAGIGKPSMNTLISKYEACVQTFEGPVFLITYFSDHCHHIADCLKLLPDLSVQTPCTTVNEFL